MGTLRLMARATAVAIRRMLRAIARLLGAPEPPELADAAMDVVDEGTPDTAAQRRALQELRDHLDEAERIAILRRWLAAIVAGHPAPVASLRLPQEEQRRMRALEPREAARLLDLPEAAVQSYAAGLRPAAAEEPAINDGPGDWMEEELRAMEAEELSAQPAAGPGWR